MKQKRWKTTLQNIGALNDCDSYITLRRDTMAKTHLQKDMGETPLIVAIYTLRLSGDDLLFSTPSSTPPHILGQEPPHVKT